MVMFSDMKPVVVNTQESDVVSEFPDRIACGGNFLPASVKGFVGNYTAL